MKYFNLLFFIGISFFSSCSDSNNNADSSTQIIQNQIKEAKSVDIAEDQYSQDFYNQLIKQEDFKDAVIQDGFILLTPTDTVFFPEQPPKGETLQLDGANEDFEVKLSVIRINYTTISYRAEINNTAGKSCEIEGTADLGAYFFSGSESDTNELTGESYLSTEFTDADEGCNKSFRLAQSGTGESVKYLAKIKVDCTEQCGLLNLDNCPILVER